MAIAFSTHTRLMDLEVVGGETQQRGSSGSLTLPLQFGVCMRRGKHANVLDVMLNGIAGHSLISWRMYIISALH